MPSKPNQRGAVRERLVIVMCGLVLASTVSCASACEDEKPLLEGDDKVLATVDGKPISRYDLKQAVQKNFGRLYSATLTKENYRTILESLVATRAIADACEKELDAKERAELEKRVAVYRDKLLVTEYLARHAPPEPASDEEVAAYYRRHLDDFGKKTTKLYEMIFTQRGIDPEKRKTLITRIGEAAGMDDWKDFANKLKKQGFPVQYRSGQSPSRVLESEISKAVETLDAGAVSKLIFIKGRIHLVRVTKELVTPPAPLEKVEGKIRELLEPAMIKRSVKRVSKDIQDQAKIIYHDQK